MEHTISIEDAAADLAAREQELAHARSAVASAREGVSVAAAAYDRAAHLAVEAQGAETAAADTARRAESTWQESQTAANWTKVEAARAQREQASLRASATRSAAEAARADHERARAHALSVENDARVIERKHTRAGDILKGLQVAARELDEAAAEERGRELRRGEETGARRDEFIKQFVSAAAPHLAEIMRGAAIMRAGALALAPIMAEGRKASRAADSSSRDIFPDSPPDRCALRAAGRLVVRGGSAPGDPLPLMLAASGARGGSWIEEAATDVAATIFREAYDDAGNPRERAVNVNVTEHTSATTDATTTTEA